MAEGSENCPICWCDFTDPRLLPCRHTFCFKCLKTEKGKHARSKFIKCPLCREEHTVPKGGLRSFLKNYYVPDVHEELDLVPQICECCGEADMLKECKHCAQRMCQNCALSHQEALLLAEEGVKDAFDDDEDGDESDDDKKSDCEDEDDDSARRNRRRRDSNVSLPFDLLIRLPTIRTRFKLKRINKFEIPCALGQLSGRDFINDIRPDVADECWVVAYGGPIVSKYNTSGDLVARIPIVTRGGDGIITFALPVPDCSDLLIGLWGENSIIRVSLMTEIIMGFTSTDGISPHSASVFPDGRVVYVGPKDKERATKKSSEVEDLKSQGSMTIVSANGEQKLMSVVHNDRGPLFVHPCSVAVNTTTRTICVADRKNGCVLVFTENGMLINTYKPTRGHSIEQLLLGFSSSFELSQSPSFVPLSMCVDNHGNILIVDAVSKLVHVLNSSGEFIGIMRTPVWRELGDPFSIAVDRQGHIWIGDESDRHIRIFEIEQYINNFARQNR